jgi:glycine cleavage system H lipoate-binding protein
MFPGIYEFQWDAGHLIFLGAFYTVSAAIGVLLAAALARTVGDLRSGRAEEIRWRQDFASLPAAARCCRHEMTGEVPRRTCTNGFDCRSCSGHAELLRNLEAKGGPRVGAREAGPEEARGEGELRAREEKKEEVSSSLGFQMPGDRLYHRGHAWARREEDGTVTVGLDDFAARLVGEPEEILLPATGSRVRLNGTGFRVRKGGVEVRILSPLDGEVIQVGGPEQGWCLRIRPGAEGTDLGHLLGGEEVGPWLLREMERLQRLSGIRGAAVCLADGGAPLADIASALSEDRRDEILGEILLDP